MLIKSCRDLFCYTLCGMLFAALIVLIVLIKCDPGFATEEKCRFQNGTKGICVKNSQCSVEQVNIGKYIGDECSARYMTCCLSENIIHEEVKQNLKHHNNYKYFENKNCGLKNQYSDNAIKVSDYPWVVSLGHKVDSHIKFTCGGTLINNRFILTTAKCVMGDEPEEKVSVIRLSIQNEWMVEEEHHTDIKYFKVISHPNFDAVSLRNNIALIRLEDPELVKTYDSTPICLPFDMEDTPDELTAVGRMSKRPKKRLDDEIIFVETHMCKDALGDLDERLICTKKIKNFSHHCNSGRGLPAQTLSCNLRRKQWILFGLLSQDFEFCDKPTVYINIYDYLSWILDNVDSP